MNNMVRYPIVLYRPKAKDIANLEERIKSGIRTAFLEEGVPEELFRGLCRMKNMPEENWEQMLKIENYQLKIKLMLQGHDIWRRILIPSSALGYSKNI